MPERDNSPAGLPRRAVLRRLGAVGVGGLAVGRSASGVDAAPPSFPEVHAEGWELDRPSFPTVHEEGWELQRPSFHEIHTEGWELDRPSFTRVHDEGWELDPPSFPLVHEETWGPTAGFEPEPVDGTVPKDPDEDGLYEDLTGNGETDLGDVVTLFQHRESPAVAENPSLYDFSGNGEVDVADAVQLFQEA